MAGVTQLAIPPEKIVEYLLNPDHAEGWSKAKFFTAHGFDRARPEELANALAYQAMRDWPGDVLQVVGATKYRIVGPIWCPDDSTPEVLSVWQAATGSDTATFVTARPYKRKNALE